MTDLTRPFVLMALNNAWANATLYDSVTRLDGASFLGERPGFFPSLARTLNHIYEVDLYYVDALESGGLGRSVYAREDIEDAACLGEAQAAVDVRLIAFCKGLTKGILSEPRETERKGCTAKETVEALLLHLFQHQVHHRGQAHVQLQDAGVAPPQLDDFYLDFDRAPSASAYSA